MVVERWSILDNNIISLFGGGDLVATPSNERQLTKKELTQEKAEERIGHDYDIVPFNHFQMWRYLKLENKYPTFDLLLESNGYQRKTDKYKELVNYSWELDMLDIVFNYDTRLFNNEFYNDIIPDLLSHARLSRKIHNKIYDEIKLDEEQIGIPTRVFNENHRINNTEKILNDYLTSEAMSLQLSKDCEDGKLIDKGKGGAPKSAKKLVYFIRTLTNIYNCLVTDKKHRQFIYDHIESISYFHNTTKSTIDYAMRQNRELRKEKIFYDLIGCKEEAEFKRILKLIM